MPGKPLAGRVAIVTGVSRVRGIGWAIAQRLSADGADLFLTGWRPYDETRTWGAGEAHPPALIEELAHAGARAVHVAADLSEPDAPALLLEKARAQFGHVDVLVANHARAHSQGIRETTAADLDMHWAVNVRATLLLVQAMALQHDGRAGGRVVLFTSGQHVGPMPGEIGYVATKGALHQVTQTLARELAPAITVNTVNPGATDTGWATSRVDEEVRAASPHHRWGSPADAARLVAWLVSDEAAWVTGQVINSTGGGR
jgi:3-oxoacyl-[acyl-carrier protein] reductase